MSHSAGVLPFTMLAGLSACLGQTTSDVAFSREDSSLGQIGGLEVRFARTPAEVRQAQRLRAEVFFREMSATPPLLARLLGRDVDRFDAFCDHLLVIDHHAQSQVVGTYRLLRQEIANRHGGFYSASEFDVHRLTSRYPELRFLELGRSCVLRPYRNKRTVELLWQGIWRYVSRHRFDVMIGCASLEGTDPQKLALPLSFLHHFCSASETWAASAVAHRYVDMNMMPKDAIDPKAALHQLPPLIKGYLRLGASIGHGAVIDHAFQTTDVLIILPVSALNPRYISHFSQASAS